MLDYTPNPQLLLLLLLRLLLLLLLLLRMRRLKLKQRRITQASRKTMGLLRVERRANAIQRIPIPGMATRKRRWARLV
jgi:hypothetical protein